MDRFCHKSETISAKKQNYGIKKAEKKIFFKIFLIVLCSGIIPFTQSFTPIPLTFSPSSREVHVSKATVTNDDKKISTIKLSKESLQFFPKNVSIAFEIHPSYHQDVSQFFRINEKGELFVQKDLNDIKKNVGFFQVAATASWENEENGEEEKSSSKIEVRVVFDSNTNNNNQDGLYFPPGVNNIPTRPPSLPPFMTRYTTTTTKATTEPTTTTPTTTYSTTETSTIGDDVSSDSTTNGDKDNTPITTVAVTVIILVLMVLAITLYLIKKKTKIWKKLTQNKRSPSLTPGGVLTKEIRKPSSGMVSSPLPIAPPETLPRSDEAISSNTPTVTIRAQSNKYEPPPTLILMENQTQEGEGKNPHPLYTPRHLINLTPSKLLGEGCFGQVWLASVTNKNQTNSQKTICACKTTKSESQNNQQSQQTTDLQKELQILLHLNDNNSTHGNVISLLGFNDDPSKPLFLLLQYANLGKLQTFLRNSRTSDYYTNLQANSTLTSRELTNFCFQIAKGMEYISECKGVVHRDLAARNILLHKEAGEFGNVVCKVADFGFARVLKNSGEGGTGAIHEEGVYCRREEDEGAKKGVRLPIRWMPPESLFDYVFTSKSDVWSFGVTMWEIVTLGSTPYPTLSPAQVISKIRSNQQHRLEKPPHCKRELYNVMYYCWNGNPKERPSFGELVKMLGELLSNDCEDYLQLDILGEDGQHCYYNCVGEEGKEGSPETDGNDSSSDAVGEFIFFGNNSDGEE